MLVIALYFVSTLDMLSLKDCVDCKVADILVFLKIFQVVIETEGGKTTRKSDGSNILPAFYRWDFYPDSLLFPVQTFFMSVLPILSPRTFLYSAHEFLNVIWKGDFRILWFITSSVLIKTYTFRSRKYISFTAELPKTKRGNI